MSVRYLNATGTQALINEIKSRLLAKADKEITDALVQRMSQLETALPTRTSQLENDSGFIASDIASELFASKSSVSELQLAVLQNTQNVALLNADAETEGSVDYKIAQVEPESISTEDIESLFANLVLFGSSNTASEDTPPTKSVEDTPPTKEYEEPIEDEPPTKVPVEEPVEDTPPTKEYEEPIEDEPPTKVPVEEPITYLDGAPIYNLDELPEPVVYKTMSTYSASYSQAVAEITVSDFDSEFTCSIPEGVLWSRLKSNLYPMYKSEEIKRGVWAIEFTFRVRGNTSQATWKYGFDSSVHTLGVYIDSDTNEFRLLSQESLREINGVQKGVILEFTKFIANENCFSKRCFAPNTSIHSPFTSIAFDEETRKLMLTGIPGIILKPKYSDADYKYVVELQVNYATFYSFDKPEEENA